MKRLTTSLLFISVLLSSCADSKDFIINGKKQRVEPYGLFDQGLKNDSIEYGVCVGNVVLDVIFCETILVPVLLVGNSLYEPIRKKQ
jgi:hypothetical protein